MENPTDKLLRECHEEPYKLQLVGYKLHRVQTEGNFFNAAHGCPPTYERFLNNVRKAYGFDPVNFRSSLPSTRPLNRDLQHADGDMLGLGMVVIQLPGKE